MQTTDSMNPPGAEGRNGGDRSFGELQKLAVLVPCMESVKAHFAFDLVNLFDFIHRNPKNPAGVNHGILQMNIEPQLIIHQTSILPLGRVMLVEHAMKAGAEWMLMLDSDMRFPCEIAHRLLVHNRPVVACQYAKKVKGVPPVIRYEASPETLQGLVQVQSVATGCLLVHRSVFERLPKPWFAFISVPGDALGANEDACPILGEDIYFSRICNEYDIPLFVDFETSKHVGHVGNVEFYLDGIRPAEG